jgi:hypothetical protein
MFVAAGQPTHLATSHGYECDVPAALEAVQPHEVPHVIIESGGKAPLTFAPLICVVEYPPVTQRIAANSHSEERDDGDRR